MTEEEAQDWICDRFGVQVYEAMDTYRALLVAEAERQNLIAASTINQIWSRHLVDSLQLVPLASGAEAGAWIDIGSGAGLPGIVAAMASDRRVLLVEPRRLRVAFLENCIDTLGLNSNATVAPYKIQHLQDITATVVSARGVARLDALFTAALHVTNNQTLWLLPKGTSAQSEVAVAKRSWQGAFHVEQSIVDPASGIVVARGVARR